MPQRKRTSKVSGSSSDESVIARLGSRVTLMGECWVLNGEPDRYHTVESGWGSMHAHRFVYQDVTGEVLEPTTHVHHTCEVKGCIRPDHLTAMSASDHGDDNL